MSSYATSGSSFASPAKGKKASKPKNQSTPRALSASEIARSLYHFETWSTHMKLLQVDLTDLPDDFKDEIVGVFDILDALPCSWIDKGSPSFYITEEFRHFLHTAHQQRPSLFSSKIIDAEVKSELLIDICTVFKSWKRLLKMNKSREKFSEKDYTDNVYNPLRSQAVESSTKRSNCSIALPMPSTDIDTDIQTTRILRAKVVQPDACLLIPLYDSDVRRLSHSVKSPYQVLASNKGIKKIGSATQRTSIRYQFTPFEKVSSDPGFEFASSFWEDKKSATQFDDAYRQNRMSTASAARHLHSLQIRSPVIGLLWSEGRVRAHIDWCEHEDQDQQSSPMIYSAPYSGAFEATKTSKAGAFKTWDLKRPSDILYVYFLVRNIDKWTVNGFKNRAVNGVKKLTRQIKNGKIYEPWRKGTTALKLKTVMEKENQALSEMNGTNRQKRR